MTTARNINCLISIKNRIHLTNKKFKTVLHEKQIADRICIWLQQTRKEPQEIFAVVAWGDPEHPYISYHQVVDRQLHASQELPVAVACARRQKSSDDIGAWLERIGSPARRV